MKRKKKYFTDKEKQEGQRAVRKLWVFKNKAKIYENHKKWRNQPENHEKFMGYISKWQKKYRQTDIGKAKISKRHKVWYTKNKDKVCETNKKWRLNNPDKVKLIKKRYAERKKNGLV